MESQTDPKAPIIEFSGKILSPGSETWASTAKQVCQALEEYGCFMIKCNDEVISSDLNDKIYGFLQNIFDMSAETKTKTICSFQESIQG